VQRIKFAQRHDFIVSAQTMLVIEQGTLQVVVPTSTSVLRARDAILIDASTPVLTLDAGEATQVIVIQFR
jgi:hypothetical protein